MIVTRNTSTDPLPLVQISLIFSKMGSQFWPLGDVVKQAPRPLKKNKHTAKATDSAVVAESIRPYAIADKLRTLRLRRSMGLTQLAEHSGFSPAMLSRLENGRLVPTLPTLTRIALVFGVGLDYFFTDPRKRE